jgi:PAS domain S-box-containing protein
MESSTDKVASYWRSALADSRQFAFVMDTRRRVVAVSAGLAEALGAAPDELVGHRCSSFMHAQDSTPETCPLHALLLDSAQSEAEVHSEVLGCDLRVTVTPLPDDSGVATLILHTAADESGRRLADAELRESEVRCRGLIEHAPVGIFRTSPAGELLSANPALAATFGFESPEELIAFVGQSSMSEALYADPAERSPRMEELHRRAGDWISYELRLRHRDGTVFEALLRSCERIDPASGEPVILGFIEDIGTDRRVRRDLEESTALLREAERLAHLGSWEWDVVSGDSHYSDEWRRIHGLGDEAMPMPEMLKMCHPADAEVVWGAIQRLRAEKVPVTFDHRIVRLDGDVRHLSAIGRPILNAAGEIEKIFGASLDVTDRVTAQRALLLRERRLQRALAGAVSALATTVEIRDPYTSGHQRRVAELAMRIAQLLGWPEERVGDMQVAAMLHDVGKVVVPAEILAKTTRLTDDELEIVKGHSLAAAEILAPVEFDGPVHEAIVQHHERLDGSGYPHGLRGDEIIAEARVLAVADVYEAMISHRPYRPGVAREDVFAELRAGAGERYDADAVEVCLQLIETGFEFATLEQ